MRIPTALVGRRFERRRDIFVANDPHETFYSIPEYLESAEANLDKAR
jgi:hypothetical protein